VGDGGLVARIELDEPIRDAVALSEDGSSLIVMTSEGLEGWDGRAMVRRFRMNSEKTATDPMALSPDSSRLATISEDGVVRLCDARSGRDLLNLGPLAGPTIAFFSPDGRRVIGSSETGVRIWDSSTASERSEELVEFDAAMRGVRGRLEPRLGTLAEGTDLRGEILEDSSLSALERRSAAAILSERESLRHGTIREMEREARELIEGAKGDPKLLALALERSEEALRLDPGSWSLALQVGEVAYAAGKFERALEALGMVERLRYEEAGAGELTRKGPHVGVMEQTILTLIKLDRLDDAEREAESLRGAIERFHGKCNCRDYWLRAADALAIARRAKKSAAERTAPASAGPAGGDVTAGSATPVTDERKEP
jgi:tetratricopeptide (TPR) repeat protein